MNVLENQRKRIEGDPYFQRLVGHALINEGISFSDVAEIFLPRVSPKGWEMNIGRRSLTVSYAKDMVVKSLTDQLPDSLIHIYRADSSVTVSLIGLGTFSEQVQELTSREARRVYLSLGIRAIEYINRGYETTELTHFLSITKERTLKTMWNAMCMRICC